MISPLIAAAISGIVLGTSAAPVQHHAQDTQQLDANGGAKHACRGQNACKGQGGCKTDKHACKGKNECKGQGGCQH